MMTFAGYDGMCSMFLDSYITGNYGESRFGDDLCPYCDGEGCDECDDTGLYEPDYDNMPGGVDYEADRLMHAQWKGVEGG